MELALIKLALNSLALISVFCEFFVGLPKHLI